MKALGRGSLSSVLSVIVTAGWYLVWIVLAVGLILLAASPFVDPPRIQTDFKIPVAFQLDPDSHRITAPASDVERVRIVDTQGWIYFVPRGMSVVAIGALA